jgi:hypothetical protein
VVSPSCDVVGFGQGLSKIVVTQFGSGPESLRMCRRANCLEPGVASSRMSGAADDLGPSRSAKIDPVIVVAN